MLRAGRHCRIPERGTSSISTHRSFAMSFIRRGRAGASQKYVDAVQGSDGALSRFATPARTFGGELIGIPQRGGPFNFVINQNRISVSDARDAGFGIALDRHFYRRFGVLSYEDFNVMHFALASGLNPFEPISDATMLTFAEACRTIWNSARVVSVDHNFLNRLLIDGDIDFYLSGEFTRRPRAARRPSRDKSNHTEQWPRRWTRGLHSSR